MQQTYNKLKTTFSYVAVLLFGAWASHAQPIAFPGAEGFGRYVTGGRGGAVYYVTNLNDSGTGSFRWAIEQSGTRTIVFKVSGTIALQSNLNIKNGNLTIAGQTAPGDGICIKNYPLGISANNVIIRFIRARLGDEKKVEADAVGARYFKDLIVDHCSMSWSVDETVSIYSNTNTTLQWCLISESLTNSVHTKEAHGYGGIWGGNKATFHHNLMAHHSSRTPRLGPGVQTQLNENTDMRNNVIYNWAGNGCYGAEAMNVNIVNNYYKPGPSTPTGAMRGRIIGIDKKVNLASTDGFYPINNKWGKFYISGNVVDASTSSGSNATVCQNATSDNWNYGVYNQIHSKYNITTAEKNALKLSSPIAFGDIVTESAAAAYTKVLEKAGCSLVRDALDLRIIEETRNGTAKYKGSISGKAGLIDTPSDVGGYPTLKSTTAPTDTDADGMPDAWESARNLNPNNSADRNNNTFSSNYTNLEVYLNSIVAHIISDGTSVITDLEAEAQPQESEVVCFPNPFVQQLRIQLKGSFSYRIMSMEGREVEQGLGQEVMEVGAALPPNIYLLFIQTEQGSKTIKIAKVE